VIIWQWRPQKNALLLDFNSDKRYYLWSNKSDVLAVHFSADRNVLFTGTRDGTIRSLDLRQCSSDGFAFVQHGSHFPQLFHRSPICSIKSLKDTNYLLSSTMGGAIALWDRRTVRTVMTYPGHVNSTTLLRFSTDFSESILFAGGQDKMLRIWEVGTGKLLNTYGPFQSHIPAVAYGDTWHKEGRSIYRPGIWVPNGPNLDFFSMEKCQ